MTLAYLSPLSETKRVKDFSVALLSLVYITLNLYNPSIAFQGILKEFLCVIMPPAWYVVGSFVSFHFEVLGNVFAFT